MENKKKKDKSWIEHTRKFNESIKWEEMFKYCNEHNIPRTNLSDEFVNKFRNG